MNPLLVDALGSIVRSVLMLLAGYVVSAGIWAPEDASKYMAALTLAILGLGWSLFNRYKSRLKILTALSADEPMTEKQLDARVKAGNTPSVTTPKDEIPS